MLAFLSSLALSGCYLTKQGVGQAQLLLSRKPVDEFVASGASEEIRAKLTLIREVKAFGEQAIGLKHTSNYQDVVALDRDAVSYVVSAAPKDRLEAFTWWFPIIGDVPYKGFFDRKDAEALQAELEAQGYDTILRGVPAFSTLGWLPDPVYSPFLKYDIPTLSNIIIHETTHATLFLSGQASFNEGFATFVGNLGAQEFLKKKYGEDSEAYRQAKAAATDNVVFTEFVQALSAKLDALYQSELPRERKLAERERVFAWAGEVFEQEYQPRMQGHQFRHFPKGKLNNASLISYRTYYNRLDRFERAHEKLGGDLRRTVAFFKEHVAKAKSPETFLDDFLAKDEPNPTRL